MPQHCTPEDLALAALGEPLPSDDAAHLADCSTCSGEVAGLRRGVEALAVPELAAPGAPVPPPAHVWAAIAASTGVTAVPRTEADPDLSPAAAAGPAPEPDAEVVPLRPRRSRLLLAAAASLVVGAGIGAGAVALGGDDDDPAVVALAATKLDPLGENEASGAAEVVERPDGTRVLRLELDAAAPDEGYLEVWLIDEAVEGMVSVGVVRAGTEELPLPPGLDIGQYPIVDVSVEQLDGDPTHSGVSIARGVLDT
ncbi:anti-sigma factor [Trujillonella humicola]|uniref:anti-sigma factor n=1 Tax=Trujillonella humicola TaxID=3383699 RepID=UPI0039059813